MSGQELDKVIEEPAGHHGVKGHEAHIAKEGKVAVDMPFLAGLFQLIVHARGTCLGGTSHGQLHHHHGKSHDQQAQNIEQHKPAAAVLSGHPREFPHIAAADGAPGTEQDKSQAAAQLFTLFQTISLFSLYSFELYGSKGDYTIELQKSQRKGRMI